MQSAGTFGSTGLEALHEQTRKTLGGTWHMAHGTCQSLILQSETISMHYYGKIYLTMPDADEIDQSPA